MGYLKPCPGGSNLFPWDLYLSKVLTILLYLDPKPGGHPYFPNKVKFMAAVGDWWRLSHPPRLSQDMFLSYSSLPQMKAEF